MSLLHEEQGRAAKRVLQYASATPHTLHPTSPALGEHLGGSPMQEKAHLTMACLMFLMST